MQGLFLKQNAHLHRFYSGKRCSPNGAAVRPNWVVAWCAAFRQLRECELRCCLASGNTGPREEKANMPLPRWALALADNNGRSGSTDAALASVISLSHIDERALVAEAQAGSRAAFEELVGRFDRDVLRLALNLMKRPEDARDVYQEAFLKVYRNLHRFRFECSFYTWLYRFVTNVCLDHLRRRQARPEDQAPEIHLNRQDEGTRDFFEFQRELRPGLDPERRLMGNEIRTRIAKAMEIGR